MEPRVGDRCARDGELRALIQTASGQSVTAESWPTTSEENPYGRALAEPATRCPFHLTTKRSFEVEGRSVVTSDELCGHQRLALRLRGLGGDKDVTGRTPHTIMP
jgi:hypothetical protein